MIPVRDTIPRRQAPMMTWALIAINAADSAAGRAEAVDADAPRGVGDVEWPHVSIDGG